VTQFTIITSKKSESECENEMGPTTKDDRKSEQERIPVSSYLLKTRNRRLKNLPNPKKIEPATIESASSRG